MKKFTMLSFLFLFGLISIAQNTDYVAQKEFQEKTKTLKSQVNLIKQTNSGLNKAVATLQTTVDKQASSLMEAKTLINSENDSIKTIKAKIAEVEQGYKSKDNNFLVLMFGLFIVLLFILLAFRNACKRNLKEINKKLNETNNVLIEQGKAADKKIAQLTIDLSNANESIKKINDLINKLAKEE
jgi:peptidoglycan hydrolase CwlO-like protein